MNQTVTDILKSNNTPFYIFDEKGFIDNYQLLESTFKAIYPNYQVCYSYKTNYTPYVCNLVKALGGLAEVVSDMEYTLAKRIGYSNDKIVYNGPSKGEMAYEHLLNGGILNIDSLDEAKRIVRFCEAHPEHNFSIGIRINLDLGGNFISRFGLVLGHDDLNVACNLIKRTPNLTLVGLHCHISRARGLDAWAKRAEIMLRAADELIEGTPKYISLGSGMFADMPSYLKEQFGGNEVPTYNDYCSACIEKIANHYSNTGQKPTLFTEPGTTVVARYFSFASRVLSIKNIRGRWIANMDGDYHNLGEICTMKKLPTSIIPMGLPQKFYNNVDIMGFTCLEQDVMVPGWQGHLAQGDIIIFENVGGYSIVSKPQFIKPQSPIFVKRSNGDIVQIARAETFDDVFNKFCFDF